MLEDGRAEEGVALINTGVAEWQAEEIGIFLPWALSCLAEGHERCGNLEGGLKVINDAFEEAERSNDSFWLAELHRLQGTFLLTLSVKNGAEAETCFHKAIDVAQEQGARSLELRAATSLAQLWRGQGKRDEALDLLAPICDWFTEGFNTPDLIRAKKLLEQLA